MKLIETKLNKDYLLRPVDCENLSIMFHREPIPIYTINSSFPVYVERKRWVEIEFFATDDEVKRVLGIINSNKDVVFFNEESSAKVSFSKGDITNITNEPSIEGGTTVHIELAEVKIEEKNVQNGE